MANSYLTKDFGSAGNRKTMTFSFWVKRNHIGAEGDQFIGDDQTAYPSHFINFASTDRLDIRSQTGVSGETLRFTTERKFRDTASWYHYVIAIDTTQATAANRLKLWVNGEQNLLWAESTQSNGFTQNSDTHFNQGDKAEYIGKYSSSYANFNLAHFHFVDGTALTASTFGETDSTTGEWKPILSPSVTYGTNGFFLKFENSGALGTDSSGNSKTWTVSGSLKQSASTPSNLFCTLNHNETYNTNITTGLKYGATAFTDADYGNDGPKGSVGTLGSTGGKWYFEVKHVEGMYSTAGISKANTLAVSKMLNTHYRSPFLQGNEGDGFGFQMDTATLIQRGDNTEAAWNDGSGSAIANFADGDICMIAYDLDAGKIWWGKNGTWNTVPGTNTTTSSSEIASGSNAHKTWTANGAFFRPAVSVYQRSYGGGAGANPNTVYCNFGEGRFGTTAVSSAVADGDGNGAFEYAPPSGFYAVCTKALQTRS